MLMTRLKTRLLAHTLKPPVLDRWIKWTVQPKLKNIYLSIYL